MKSIDIAKLKRVDIQPLAYGEVTGHMHALTPLDHEGVEMYQITDTSFVLVANGEGMIRLVHGTDPSNLAPVADGEDRHGMIPLDPTAPVMVRQGDVALIPYKTIDGRSAWVSRRQTAETPDGALREVAD